MIGFSVRHAPIVVLATVLVTLAFGWFAFKVRINPDFTSLLPPDAEVNKLLHEYGGDPAPADLLVFAVTATEPGRDIFSPDSLSAFSAAVTEIGALPGVQSTISPFNLVSFGKENGRLSVRPMSPGGFHSAPDAAEGFRARLTDTRYAKNFVVSSDATMLISYFQTAPMGSYTAFMEKVNAVASGARARGLTPYVTGTIPLSVRTEYHISHDATRLLILAAAIILLAYIVGFRSPRAVALPLLSTLFGTLWTVGFMGLMGFSLSLISIVAPPLILIFGNEYNIFTTSEYLRVARVEGAAPGWIERASRNVAKPIFMAFVTTIIGFLSLLTTSIRQTREFAVTASFGSLACAFLALFFLPAMFSLMKPPTVRIHVEGGAFQRLMTRVGRFAHDRPAVVLATFGASVLLFAATVHLLIFNTDPASYFPQNDPVLRDMSAIYGKAGGYEQVSVSFDAPRAEPGYFLNADVLARVQSAEEALRTIPDISYAVSLPDLLRDINKSVTGEDAIPSNRAVVMMFSRLLSAAGGASASGAILGNMTNRDFTRLTLSFRIYNSDTGHYMDENRFRSLLVAMHKALEAHPVGATPVIWGDLLRNLSFADSLRRSLLLSMAISVVSILVLTIFVFRSPLFGLYPLIPLIGGLLLNYAMMALTRIPLDMTTIMVSNIAIGVGVDSAIYVVIQYRRELAALPGDPQAAIVRTLTIIGQPVLLSSLSIAIGLLVFATAAFRPIVYFGMLVLFTLLATTLGTLVTLPTLLALDTRARHSRGRRA
jgi:predicted RND superfamily exporter protein